MVHVSITLPLATKATTRPTPASGPSRHRGFAVPCCGSRLSPPRVEATRIVQVSPRLVGACREPLVSAGGDRAVDHEAADDEDGDDEAQRSAGRNDDLLQDDGKQSKVVARSRG